MTFLTGPVQLGDHAGWCLVIAGLCLAIALRFMKRALEPLGAIVEALAAAAGAAVAVTLALVLVLVVAVAR
jgi:hypothetical protein